MGKHWDNVYNSGSSPWAGVPDKLQEKIKSLEPKPKTALDLGCGQGDKSLWLAEQGYQVTGIDVSKEAIEQAKAKRSDESNPVFLEEDLTKPSALDFPDQSFGLVLDLLAVHFLQADVQARIYKKIHSLLVPGGFVIHSRLNALNNQAPGWVTRLPVTPDAFEKMLAGFTVVEKVVSKSKNLPETDSYFYILQRKPG